MVVVQNMIRDVEVEHVDEPGGKPHEQDDGEGHPEQHGDDADDRHHLLVEVVFQPLVEFAGLRVVVRVLVEVDLVGGVHEILVTVLHGLEKGDDTADDREFRPLVGIGEMLLALLFDVDSAVRVVDGDRGALGSAHHDALDEGLAANTGLMLFFAQRKILLLWDQWFQWKGLL